MQSFLAISSGLITIGACVPYIKAILKGKAQPARSTRFMFIVLMLLALFQQKELGSTWSLLLIYAEIVIAVTIFIFSIFYGTGGFNKLDLYCYFLLAVDIAVWQTAQNPLLAIHLTIIADAIACVPTIVKTYKHPKSEAPIFWFLGLVGGSLSALSEASISYSKIVFPLYIALINGFIWLLSIRTQKQDTETSRRIHATQ